MAMHLLALVQQSTRLAPPVEDQHRHRDRRRLEQIRRQADDGIEQVLLDHLLPDLTFSAAAEQHAMRHDDCHAPGLLPRRFDHMGNERPVARALRRDAAMKPLVLIVGGVFRAPFVQREGRIGDDHVEGDQPVILDELRIGQRVAPFEPRAVDAVQEHVHLGERVRAAINLLTVEHHMARADELRRLDQQRSGTAGRVADLLAGVRLTRRASTAGT